MRLSFETQKETNLKILLPIRWRNLYPDNSVDPQLSRETDIAPGTTHFVAKKNDGVFGCVTLIEEAAHGRQLRLGFEYVGDSFDIPSIGPHIAMHTKCITP